MTTVVEAERLSLAFKDPEGEREAVSPVPGSIAYWERQIERPLRGAFTLDDMTVNRLIGVLERIAFALEQRTLEVAELNGARQPQQYQATPAPQFGVPSFNPPACPIHNQPWRNGARGAYCPRKMRDGTWCVQRPQIVGVPALP